MSEYFVLNNILKNNNNENCKYEQAPNLLMLKDSEKFKDNKGGTLEIEVRGIKGDTCNIFFLVVDVSRAFKLNNRHLVTTITNKKGSYLRHIHYKTFICTMPNNVGLCKIKKQLYVTYGGILKILFSSRSHIATSYVLWATNTLFTMQMGTFEQKKCISCRYFGNSIQKPYLFIISIFDFSLMYLSN